MPKGNRTLIHLVSFKKYDPRFHKHVLFVEGKP
ncbi:50S ribosomal protein L33 [Corallococcus sp. M7]